MPTSAARRPASPILVDRRFVEADLRIVVGLVEPHFMAGYSGGRKLVIPGVAHSDTILKLHAGVILDHPSAANTVLEGNPLHQEQLHMVRAVGEILALNVVIDEERRIGFVNFGPIEQSHLEAVAFMRRYCGGARPAPVQDRGHHQRRLPPGQDLLPDDQGHGRRHRHPGARRDHHHRQRVLGRDGQPGIRGGPARALPGGARALHGRASSPATMRASTSGRPRCW